MEIFLFSHIGLSLFVYKRALPASQFCAVGIVQLYKRLRFCGIACTYPLLCPTAYYAVILTVYVA